LKENGDKEKLMDKEVNITGKTVKITVNGENGLQSMIKLGYFTSSPKFLDLPCDIESQPFLS